MYFQIILKAFKTQRHFRQQYWPQHFAQRCSNYKSKCIFWKMKSTEPDRVVEESTKLKSMLNFIVQWLDVHACYWHCGTTHIAAAAFIFYHYTCACMQFLQLHTYCAQISCNTYNTQAIEHTQRACLSTKIFWGFFLQRCLLLFDVGRYFPCEHSRWF